MVDRRGSRIQRPEVLKVPAHIGGLILHAAAAVVLGTGAAEIQAEARIIVDTGHSIPIPIIVHVAGVIIRIPGVISIIIVRVICQSVFSGVAVGHITPVNTDQLAERIDGVDLSVGHIAVFNTAKSVVRLIGSNQAADIHIRGSLDATSKAVYMRLDSCRKISVVLVILGTDPVALFLHAVTDKGFFDQAIIYAYCAAYIEVAQHRAGHDRAAGNGSVLLVPAGNAADLSAADVVRSAGFVAGHGAVSQVAVLNGAVVEAGKTAHPVTAIDISAVQSEILDLTILSNSGKQAHTGIGLEARTGIQTADGMAVAVQHAGKARAVEIVIFTAGTKSKGCPGFG